MVDKLPQLIDTDSPAWKAVEQWAYMYLAKQRGLREDSTADLRKLDQLLGSIKILNELLDLPAAIRKERLRDPVQGDSFDIPNI